MADRGKMFMATRHISVTMKAVVLGGAGVIGSYAVQCLSRADTFSSIRIADVNDQRAQEISNAADTIEWQHLDVTDEQSLRDSLQDADVVVNCVGPFYKFAPKILKTAIDAGVDYVDVCDDYDTTETVINDLHQQAEDTDVTCIVGLGASPGLTNVIAAYAANELDSVTDVGVYVTRGIGEQAGAAIPYHMLHCWLGPVPVYRNGQRSMARGLVDGQQYVTFPEPFGQAPVYYFGHPETVTLPRYIPDIKNACCKGTFFPAAFRDALLQAEALGLTSDTPIHVQGHEIAPLDFMAAYVSSLGGAMLQQSKDVPSGGAVMVEVSGTYKGEPQTYRFSGTSHMREGTATPAALGAMMLASGDITSPGVQAPEACVPPRRFLNRMMQEDVFGDVWMTITEKITGEL